MAEAADGRPGEGVAIIFLRGAQARVRVNSGADEEQREVMGLREAERGLPIGLDGVFVSVGEDEIFLL